MKTIGIFPASGGLGGSTYEHLLKLVPHNQVTLISRDPSKIPSKYTTSGVTTRQASYESSPSELEAVFKGLDVLFLISYPSHVHEYRVKVQLPAIDAARRAGVTHVFYSSLAYARENDQESVAMVMQAHLSTEKHLRKLANEDKNFTYTSIREGLYHESFPIYTSFFDPKNPGDGVVRIPHDGSGPGVSWAKRDELGEASAKLIASYAQNASSSGYTNATVLLTGEQVLTLNEIVKVLSEVAGKSVRIEQVSLDEYVKQPGNQEAFGHDEEKIRTWATAWQAIRNGECDVVNHKLKEILGREPEPYEVTIKGGGEFQNHG